MKTLLLLFPATGLAAIGYLVLYFAGRSEGGMKAFGKLLGGWMLLLAGVVALAGITGPVFGGRPFGLGPTNEERLQRRMEMRQKMMQGMRMLITKYGYTTQISEEPPHA